MLTRRMFRKPLILATILALCLGLFPVFVAPAAAAEVYCYSGDMVNVIAQTTGFSHTTNHTPVYVAASINGTGLIRTVNFIEISSFGENCESWDQGSVEPASHLSPGELQIFAFPDRWTMTAYYIQGSGLTISARLRTASTNALMGLWTGGDGRLQNSSQITIFIPDMVNPTVAPAVGPTANVSVKGNACIAPNRDRPQGDCNVFQATYTGTIVFNNIP